MDMVQPSEISSTTKGVERHVAKFRRLKSRLTTPEWVYPLHKAGIERFAELGFPTLKDEDWRFTNVAPVARLPFRPVTEPASHSLTPESIRSMPFGKTPGYRLVFVDGHFDPALSNIADLPSGAVVASIGQALQADLPGLREHLGRHADIQHQPFTALNTAFFQDGAFIRIPDGLRLEMPIHLLFASTAGDSGATSCPRVLLIAGKASKATVIEHYRSLDAKPSFTNVVTELVAEDQACIEHCKFQDESLSAFHVAALHVHAGRDANIISHSISTGARLFRSNIRTVLAGPGLECTLNGLYLTRDDQTADHHMVVEHAQPHCASHEYFNGILDGKSKGVFHGRILVRQEAQKTDAKQTNKNLLLSDKATVDTKPQLEIYADDVKCTHGASIGQINEESVFYLRSRAISQETARRMLIHAFAGEIIERVRHPEVRDTLDKLIWDRLESNPHVSHPEL